ncbi:MAG: hypothetical protein Q4E46_03310 [Candidatus Saccharibacteria bacterium]|nr:hypothetical protein [Candidatus Saccharibacteria bacterium]
MVKKKVEIKSEAEKIEAEKQAEKDKAEKYSHLVAVKEEVKELERSNWSSVIAFTSGDSWFKVGFNSLLIFEFGIRPRFKTVPFSVRNDSDNYAYSKTGIISIRNILQLADILQKADGTIPETLQKYFKDGELVEDAEVAKKDMKDYYTFKIKGMTKAKIKTYLEEHFRDEKELNELVLPFYIPQKLYPDARYLAQLIADISTRFPKEIRETYGQKITELSIQILRDINMSCNGYGDGANTYIRTLNMTLFRCAEIIEILRILMDIRIIKPKACSIVLKIAIKVQADAKEELKKVQEKGENPVVAAIKKAKEFPKLDGVNLDDKIATKVSNVL